MGRHLAPYSMLGALRLAAPHTEFLYAQGYPYAGHEESGHDAALQIAKDADLVTVSYTHLVEKTPADWALLANLPQEDTRNVDYVWLPILFDGDTVKIEWRDSWKLEDYE